MITLMTRILLSSTVWIIATVMLVSAKELPFAQPKELDDAVSAYLAELKDVQVYTAGGNEPPRRPMTIRDLLWDLKGLVYDVITD